MLSTRFSLAGMRWWLIFLAFFLWATHLQSICGILFITLGIISLVNPWDCISIVCLNMSSSQTSTLIAFCRFYYFWKKLTWLILILIIFVWSPNTLNRLVMLTPSLLFLLFPLSSFDFFPACRPKHIIIIQLMKARLILQTWKYFACTNGHGLSDFNLALLRNLLTIITVWLLRICYCGGSS